MFIQKIRLRNKKASKSTTRYSARQKKRKRERERELFVLLIVFNPRVGFATDYGTNNSGRSSITKHLLRTSLTN
ncbi:hypothetical protein BpHYR1_017158 [Brachionus plicatilis]|uniref:Uncharacterized protein n=1 Tax=Brachionus plicatilis TaxID=10195 RepID=A0A3M7SR96_BRAPC|nr:hypothetical protein BpHYR1_017158 [Brachionus plicatilis]